jgi:hypothetical protein
VLGLVPATYLDSTGAEVTCPDPNSGLYVRSRAGRLIKAVPPPGCLLFQVSFVFVQHVVVANIAISATALQAQQHC